MDADPDDEGMIREIMNATGLNDRLLFSDSVC
jgi:hypothetical protein